MSSKVYSYEEAFQNSLNYFNGDDLAASAFLSKYALKNNKDEILEDTPEKMHRRLAKEFARIQKNKYENPLTEKEIFELFDGFKKIIPQGSPMFGIGNNYQIVSISNCFVLDAPEDSYNSILDVDKQLVNISKRRGGVGIDLSNLRPRGAVTNNAARSSTGIISWMERYSNSIREVGQSGRRGALMLTLSIHHPDVLDFATIKNDNVKVTGANISLKLTQEFLDAVEQDKDYEVRFPINYKELGIKPKVSKLINARKVWKTIIHSAWLRAEPGLLMWDNVLKGPADSYSKYKSISTNPCMPKWAPVLTPKGLSTIGDINIGDEIWSETGWTKVINKWSTGTKKVNAYRTTFGTFYGTENHRIVSGGEKTEAKDADSIDLLRGNDISNAIFSLGKVINNQDVIDGIVFGDGSVHHASNDLVHLYIGQDDQDYFNSEIKDYILKHRSGISDYAYEIITKITASELPKTYNRVIPERYIKDSLATCGFLRGLYTANGSICGNRVTLKATSFKVIEQVQLMLNSIGIASYYTINKPTEIEFNNGTYESKQSYDLNITRDIHKFYGLIGFIQKYKDDKLKNIIDNKNKSKTENLAKDIISIDYISDEEVFDITVDNEPHTFWTGGLNVSNCAEIAMPALEACRLLAINLFGYVKNPFTKEAYFDVKEFENDTKIAQRLMDDIVDLESEKIDQILTKIKNDPESQEIKQDEIDLWTRIKKLNDECRRTGLGITALGDALAAIGVKYGSEKSIEITEKIYKILKLSAYKASIEMAKELGSFNDYDSKVEESNEFIQRIKEDDSFLYNQMIKNGRRNIALTTTAPTGTVSIMAQTSSGIEPIFNLSYKRRKKVNPNDKNTRIDFTDQNGDNWQEYDVYHPKLKVWMEVTGETDITKSPWFGATANDIDWINRVKLQAGAQKHVCHAISSTINLPETVTEDKVAEIYETSFKMGLKGITVYRDNCRSGVLVNKTEPAKNQRIQKTKAPKRPQELPCDVHHVNFKSKRYYVVVGIMDGDPYEVFTGENNDGEGDVIIPKSIKLGKLVKKARGKYVMYNEEREYSAIITNDHSDDNADALTRLISSGLRHGTAIHFIVEQLEKTKGDLTTFSKVLARTLKKYIVDGVEVNGELCPECKSKLIRQSGCVQCSNCSWTKCS